MDPLDRSVGTGADLAALQEHQYHLQNLLIVTLVALMIMSAGVGLFIFKQMRLVQQQVAEQRPNFQRMAADYQRTSEPLIRNFSIALFQFATTNADFRPIVEKYRPLLSNYVGTTSVAVPTPRATTNP